MELTGNKYLYIPDRVRFTISWLQADYNFIVYSQWFHSSVKQVWIIGLAEILNMVKVFNPRIDTYRLSDR